MSSLDDIKKKLNIEDMDDKSRKQMFEKFVEGGGQVIEDKPKKVTKPRSSRRRVSTGKVSSGNRRRGSNTRTEKHSSHGQPGPGSYVKDALLDSSKKKYPFFQFIKGIFSRYYTFGGQFNKKISKNIQDDFNTIFSTLNFICGQIIGLEPEERWQMIEFVNKKYETNYELILRIYDLYKINHITKIQSYFSNVGNIQCPEIVESIYFLYRELVVIYPFWESCKDAIWKGATYYEKLSGQPVLLQRNKINKHIDRIFGYYLPFFHQVLCYNLGDKIPFEFSEMKKYSNIKEDEDIGVFTRELKEEKKRYLEELEREKEERKKALEEAVTQKEIEKIPKFIKNGLEIVEALITSIPGRMKVDKNAKVFEENEKMLHFYFLFTEFDKEYSFVLTSSQLKMTTRLESGVRTDIRQELDEEFIKFNEINNFLKEYLGLMKEFHNIKIEFVDSPLLLKQKVATVNVKRSKVFNEAKSKAAALFKKLSLTLQKLINDYRGERLLLQNAEDKLSFRLTTGGTRRKFENVPIIKAIAATFSFVSALHYYLIYDRLSQRNLYFSENDPDISAQLRKEKEKSEQKAQDQETQEQEAAGEDDQPDEEETSQSDEE